MDRPNIVRMHLCLPRPLSDRLEEVAHGPGVSKSRIINDALAAFLERKGSDEIELRFAQRLNRISNQLERIERICRIGLESQALFVRYMLSVNAPLAEDDEASRAIARDRFNAFVERVARQIARGPLTFLPDEDER